VDFALRTIVRAMLATTDGTSSGSSGAVPVLTEAERQLVALLPAAEVRLCLEYLRIRVGVPRDMTVHGARQFRAHINWFIDQL
jgi:hypothetical protein